MTQISTEKAIDILLNCDLVILTDENGDSAVANFVGHREESEPERGFVVSADGWDDIEITNPEWDEENSVFHIPGFTGVLCPYHKHAKSGETQKTADTNAPPELFKGIEEQWATRFKTQGYKHASAKYLEAEGNFFAGVMCGLHAAGIKNWAPPRWVIGVMRGDPLVPKNTPKADQDKTMVSIPGNNGVPPTGDDK